MSYESKLGGWSSSSAPRSARWPLLMRGKPHSCHDGPSRVWKQAPRQLWRSLGRTGGSVESACRAVRSALVLDFGEGAPREKHIIVFMLIFIGTIIDVTPTPLPASAEKLQTIA